MGKVKVRCNFCEKEVYKYPSAIRGTNNYCDKVCWKNDKYNSFVVSCDNCHKDFSRRNSALNYKHHFCSTECHHDHMSKHNKGEQNHFYGKAHTETSKEKMRVAAIALNRKGENSPLYERHPVECDQCETVVYKISYLIERSPHQFCSVECHGRWKSDNLVGENNHNWNHNLTEEDRTTGRKYPEYTSFVKTVLQRDGYCCDICENKDGRRDLNVHHLNGYGWDIDNRTNPDNGVTLCKDCHTDFHRNYGFGNNTVNQYNEYRTLMTNKSEVLFVSV